jgi:glycosyltransferase involved in cell wall biosynthesis
MGVEHTLKCHHIHQTSPEAMSAASQLGIPEDRMTLLPYGVWTESFSEQPNRDERERIRHRYGLPIQDPVILCVAALNRTHKRVDHLVAELGRMEAKPHLLLCGAVDDPTVLEDARRTLGPEAVTHAYVTASEMGSLYRASDLCVLPSLVEGFGLGVIEAQLSGLPVVAHDSAHFRWLLGEDAEQLVDMSSPGALAGKLKVLLADLPRLQESASARRLRQAQRYDWKNVLPEYIAMYARAAAHPPTLIESLVDGR